MNAELVAKLLTANTNFIYACKLNDEALIAKYRNELAELKSQLGLTKVGA